MSTSPHPPPLHSSQSNISSGSPLQHGEDEHIAVHCGRSYFGSANRTAVVVNKGSGEQSSTAALIAQLQSDIGAERVYILNKETFENPALLADFIKAKALIADDEQSDANPMTCPRGTVVVAGGDGTVSFVYQVLGKISEDLNESDHSQFAEQQQRWVMPALATIPLGTGNDYSNCMGFGCAYKTPALCYASDHTPLMELVNAPCAPFDRWQVSFMPLRIAQQFAAANPKTEGEAGDATSVGPSVTDCLRAVPWDSVMQSHVRKDRKSGAREADAAAHEGDAPNEEEEDDEVEESNSDCYSYHLINYLGVGYDAYITAKFDTSRRNHPSLCSSRTTNKLVYGAQSFKGAVYCSKLKQFLPMICVPDETDRSKYVGLALPGSSKALVLTNVNRYASGCKPWGDDKKPVDPSSVTWRRVDMEGGELVRLDKKKKAKNDATDAFKPPVLMPASTMDGRVEVQSMGGIFHYFNLQLGISSSDKLTQTGELFIFVLCTPQDLLEAPGTYTPYSDKEFDEMRKLLKKKARSTLYVQVDGEALKPLREPTIIRVTKEKGEVWARHNPEASASQSPLSPA